MLRRWLVVLPLAKAPYDAGVGISVLQTVAGADSADKGVPLSIYFLRISPNHWSLNIVTVLIFEDIFLTFPSACAKLWRTMSPTPPSGAAWYKKNYVKF